MNESATIKSTFDRSSLPRWKCHKIVRAAPIRAIYKSGLTNEMESTRIEDRPWIVYLDGGHGDGYPGFTVPAAMFARYMPVPGDYFVVYDDDYESVSPKKVFEEGYSQVQVQEA